MDYRKAVIGDISQIVNIRLAYLKENHGYLSEDQIIKLKGSLPVYFEKHLGKYMMAYVAADGEEIVSTVCLLIVEKPANTDFITGKTGTVLNVYTKPEYRKKGIAGKLVKMMLEDAKNMELSFVELQATKMGKPLYEEIGFKIKESEYTPMRYDLI